MKKFLVLLLVSFFTLSACSNDKESRLHDTKNSKSSSSKSEDKKKKSNNNDDSKKENKETNKDNNNQQEYTSTDTSVTNDTAQQSNQQPQQPNNTSQQEINPQTNNDSQVVANQQPQQSDEVNAEINSATTEDEYYNALRKKYNGGLSSGELQTKHAIEQGYYEGDNADEVYQEIQEQEQQIAAGKYDQYK